MLRRHPEVRRRPVHGPRDGRPRRDPRGLHPERLPGRRREARHHARPDGRQPDDVRRLRPRLRAARGTPSTRTRCCQRTPTVERRLAAREQRATRRTAARPRPTSAKACWAGGTIQIYINPTAPDAATRRNAAGPRRRSAKAAFQNLTDPANPGKQVVLKIMKKEELRNVDGSDSLHPNRSGDVVVVLRPPYQSDAGANGAGDRAVALLRPARLPARTPSTSPNNINMHATFVAAGPGIKHKRQRQVAGCAAIDIAPTLAFLMDIPGPQNARGRILYDILERRRDALHEVTILDISDYHGQLIPLTDTADTHRAARGLHHRRLGVPQDVVRHLRGRGGARRRQAGRRDRRWPPATRSARRRRSRPSSSDRPTIEIMNLMGIDIDGLGNHNFDQRRGLLAATADPARELPVRVGEHRRRERQDAGRVVAVAHVQRSGRRQGRRRRLHQRRHPVADEAGRARPVPRRATRPHAVNAEAARIRARRSDAVVAIGHLGATAGTLTARPGRSSTSPTTCRTSTS